MPEFPPNVLRKVLQRRDERKRKMTDWPKKGDTLVRGEDYDAIAARLAEAERDAARYRWLRRLDAGGIQVYVGGDDASVFGNDLDAAIDAAMAADSAGAVTEKKCGAFLSNPCTYPDCGCHDGSASVAPETESDRPCVEDDGCPTEKAVLQRFWRQQMAQAHQAKNAT